MLRLTLLLLVWLFSNGVSFFAVGSGCVIHYFLLLERLVGNSFAAFNESGSPSMANRSNQAAQIKPLKAEHGEMTSEKRQATIPKPK